VIADSQRARWESFTEVEGVGMPDVGKKGCNTTFYAQFSGLLKDEIGEKNMYGYVGMAMRLSRRGFFVKS